MHIPRSLWEPVGTCGLQTGIDGGTYEDCSDSKFGSTAECEIVAPYSGKYGVLQKFYQRLCPDHRTDGKYFEKGCHVLLE